MFYNTIVRMGQFNPEDKRRFARSKLILPVRYLNLKTNQEGRAQMRDISDRGIGLEAEEELAPATPLDIWLQLPDGGLIYASGTVAWSAKLEGGKFAVGISLGEETLHALQIAVRAVSSLGQ